jgi:hypothetical protein
LIWDGFTFRWANTPHRLSILGSRFTGATVIDPTVDAESDFSLKIGNFPPDVAAYQVSYTPFATDALFVGEGMVSRLLAAKMGSTKQLEATIEVSFVDDPPLLLGQPVLEGGPWLSTRFNEQALKGADTVHVLLSGFRVRATNFDPGWHFGDLLVHVTNPRLIGGGKSFAFDLTLRVRPDQAPDPLTGTGPLGGFDPNEDAQYEIQTFFTVLAGRGSALCANGVTVNVATTNEVGDFTRAFEQKLVGRPGYPAAFVGLTGFDMSVFPGTDDLGTEYRGRYIRAMGLHADAFTYDASRASGAAKGAVEFSNDGLLSFSWGMQANVLLSMVQTSAAVAPGILKVTGTTTEDSNETIVPVAHGA